MHSGKSLDDSLSNLELIKMCYPPLGTSGVLWAVIWFALVRNSPSKQPCISAKELEYIESSLGSDLHAKVNETSPGLLA